MALASPPKSTVMARFLPGHFHKICSRLGILSLALREAPSPLVEKERPVAQPPVWMSPLRSLGLPAKVAFTVVVVV